MGGNQEAAERAARRESMRVAREAQEQTQAAQLEAESRISSIRDANQAQVATEEERHTAALEGRKQKGYEAIRKLQQEQQAQLAALRREGERDLKTLEEYYRNAVYKKAKDGDENLRALQVQGSISESHERRLADATLDRTRQDSAARLQDALKTQERAKADLHESFTKDYEGLKESAAEARERAQESFLDKHEAVVSSQARTLGRVASQASAKVSEIRRDTASKLSAYATRQADPFYQLREIGARIEETGDAYVLTATIPSHEQHSVQVSVRGDRLVVSGARRSDEKEDMGPGRSVSTSSYQNYSESFPLTHPVEARRLQREFDGDELTVYLPKKQRPGAPTYQAKRPDKARVERPKFPENLPKVEAEPVEPEGSRTGEAPPPKGFGFRTLS